MTRTYGLSRTGTGRSVRKTNKQCSTEKKYNSAAYVHTAESTGAGVGCAYLSRVYIVQQPPSFCFTHKVQSY